jgi:hypothetical protein
MIAGAFFTEFSPERHVLPASILQKIPSHTLVYRSFDWGYAKPFSVGWYAVSDGTWGPPRDAIVKIMEWYGCSGIANEGLRMDVGMVARGIKAKDNDLRQYYGLQTRFGVADPAIFIRDGGPSIAETMLSDNVVWQRADNKRDAGWQQVRHRLVGSSDGHPLLYFLETCDDTIRTLPVLQHDPLPNKAEDLDTEGEDHAADDLRYACMARPWTIEAPADASKITYPKNPGEMTFNDLLAMNRERRLRSQTTLP